MGDGNFQLPRRFDDLLQGSFRQNGSVSPSKISESGGNLLGPGSSSRREPELEVNSPEKFQQTRVVYSSNNTPNRNFTHSTRQFRPQFLPLGGFPQFKTPLIVNPSSAPAIVEGANSQSENPTPGPIFGHTSLSMTGKVSSLNQTDLTIRTPGLNVLTGKLLPITPSTHSSISSANPFPTQFSHSFYQTNSLLTPPTYSLSTSSSNPIANNSTSSSPLLTSSSSSSPLLTSPSSSPSSTSPLSASPPSSYYSPVPVQQEQSLIQLVQSRALPSSFPSSTQSGFHGRTFQSYGINSSMLLIRNEEVTKSGKIKKTPQSPQKNQTIRQIDRTIIGSYDRDLDLRSLHNMILTQMENNDNDAILVLRAKYDKEMEKFNKTQHICQRSTTIENIFSIRAQIAEFLKGTGRQKYLDEIRDILSSYEVLGPLPESIDFTSEVSTEPTEDLNDPNAIYPVVSLSGNQGKGSPYEYSYRDKETKTDHETDQQQEYRHGLISRFLQIASKYIQLDIIRNFPKQCRGDCSVCGSNVYQDMVIDGEPIMCQNCGTEVLIVVKITTPASPQVGASPQRKRADYANWKTTEFRYLCIQGRVTVVLPVGYEEKLDEYFLSVGKPTGRKTRNMTIRHDGKRGDITIDELLKALSKVGLSKEFEHVHLIAREYLGWKLPDYSAYDEKFSEYYDKSEEGFAIFKGEERSSTMNSWYRVWWLLNLIGIPYPKEDLRMITTKATRDYYDELRRKISDYYGWPHLETLSGFFSTINPENGDITIDWGSEG